MHNVDGVTRLAPSWVDNIIGVSGPLLIVGAFALGWIICSLKPL